MSVLDRALQFVTQAIAEDNAQNYESAYRLYASGINEMELAFHMESDPGQKQMLSDKITEYKNRMKQIEAIAALAGTPIPQEDMMASQIANISDPGAAAMAAQVAQASGVGLGGELAVSSIQQSAVMMQNESPAEMKVRAENNLKIPAALPGAEAWQTAQDLVERGKNADMSKDFVTALEYYECAMAYFMRAINSEDVLTKDMKATARNQMKVYLDRAEKIQQYLERCGMRATDSGDLNSAAARSLAGLCTACGKPMTRSIYALDRQWHPECFIAKVPCAFCKQPFSKVDLRFVVSKDNGLPYHVACYDNITGLSREVEKSFPPHHGKMYLKVNMIGRKIFRAGEDVELEFIFDNTTKIKLNNVVIMIMCEDAHTQFNRSVTVDRAEVSKSACVHKIEHQFGGILPMATGRFTERMVFKIPTTIQPTVVGDVAMRREYTLRIRGNVSAITGSLTLEFPITIN